MAERVKEIRKKVNSAYGESYPLGADAKYVDLENNKTVQAVIGDYQKISPIAEIIEKHFYGSMNSWNNLTLDEKKDYDVVDILNEYTIHYENNGGSGSMTDGKKLQGDNYIIASNEFTHSNTIGDEYIEDNGYRYKDIYSHSFDKWNTETDGSGINYNPNSIYSDNKNLTLYAQWTNIDTGVADPDSEQYYLTITKDEGIESCTDSQWVDKGDSVNIEAIPKNGYEIIGGIGNTGAINEVKTVNIISEELKAITLKFSSDEPFTLSVANPGWLAVANPGYIEYTLDNGDNWTEWDGSQLSGTVNQPILLRGRNNTVITSNASNNEWTFTGKYCTGNIETLLDWETVASGEHPTMAAYCYAGMFYNCTSLTTAPQLSAVTLTNYCYNRMFSYCTSLTIPPELSAIKLAKWCCYGMFADCTSLTTAPQLPATELAESCYNSMFAGCISLTTVPQLPATELANYCYQNMFASCISLTTVPNLLATMLTNYCYYHMFIGCTSLKLSTTQDNITYKYEYRIPTVGTGTTANGALDGMFDSTVGTFTGTPVINTTYYTDHEPV